MTPTDLPALFEKVRFMIDNIEMNSHYRDRILAALDEIAEMQHDVGDTGFEFLGCDCESESQIDRDCAVLRRQCKGEK